MPKTEQRAFAAVNESGFVDLTTISATERYAAILEAHRWPGGWVESKLRGWRIRPVLIRVEDETQETTHDR